MSAEQSKSDVYFGDSRESIEAGEVKLTKFNSLPLDCPSLALQMSDNDTDDSRTAVNDDHLEANLNSGNKLVDQTKSLSASELLQLGNKLSASRKWPWSVSTTGLKAESGNHMSLQQQQQDQIDSEQFQVVWRRLLFEVNLSTYDQLIGRTLRRVRSLWPLKRVNTNKSDKGKEAQNISAGLSSSDNLGVPKKRVIFENLNGHVNSGEISAILGPSGSGKTSLLNAICGRVDNYRGSVQLIGGGNRRMRLSIIPQKDYLIENLTVRENLLYSSKILNTDKNFDHDANILRIVKTLNLINCFESSAANISGGEYKRVSIAQELLRQPDILILDEPTSGLDSLNCKNLIKSLVQLIGASRRGSIKPIAIVMTIHQPDVDIFQMFDHVYCMSRCGKVIFDGRPSEVMETVRTNAGFADNQLPVGLLPGTCMGTNPANLLIEIASEDIYGREPVERLSEYQHLQFQLRYAAGNSKNTNANNNDRSLSSDPCKLDLGKESRQVAANNDNNIGYNVDKTKSLISLSIPSNFQPSSESTSSIGASSTSNNNYININRDANNQLTKGSHLVRDKRLNAKNDHSGQFWHHTNLLARRAFTSTVRDPLMTLISMMFHLTIPFVMWTVYSRNTGSVRACPVIQRELDMVSMVSNRTMGKVEDLQEQLMTALECSTMFFLSTYSFSMCSLSVAALAFPLNMHILLKEVRNGWYNLPSYVVAKTIANFPFEVLFPVISLVMIYVMLGMPSSYLEWRLWAIALVMALISMISHTQGLIFGALCMDSVQTAIFLASASTLPLTLLSGFTARIRHMPALLQKLSWLSLYRYSSDSINMIRFGFGTCPCDTTTDEYLRTKEPYFSDIPAHMKPVFTYYLINTGPTSESELPTTTIASGGAESGGNSTLASITEFVASGSNATRETLMNLIPGVSYDLTLNASARSDMINKIESNQVDLFGRMANLMARSFSYGRDVESCSSVRSQLLTTADAPKDEFLPFMFGGMFGLLLTAKLILFVIVKFKIGSRV